MDANKAPRRKRRGIKCAPQAAGFQPAYAPRSEELNPKRLKKESLGVLSLAALGLVYGDIGTSPLYVMKTVFDRAHGLAITDSNIIGVISLIFWTIMMGVVKYISLMLHADNHGEKASALLSLASSSTLNHLF